MEIDSTSFESNKTHEIMKTQTFNTARLFYLGTLIFAFLCFSGLSAQETVAGDGITVSGIVKTEDGPLLGANVSLKGTNVGTTTDRDGKFTFPRPLKLNDVLVFSYLSYNTKEIRIADETNFFDVTLTDDLIELLGAPAVNKP